MVLPCASRVEIQPIDFHTYEPRHGHGLSHNPLNALVAPRPIGWISTWAFELVLRPWVEKW